MASKYQFAIISRDTEEVVVKTEPRDSQDIIEQFCERLAAKGVGVFRTTNHVTADARATLEELIHELKAKVRP